MANELLSKQKHYDWGLRSLKTVLNMASRIREEHLNRSEAVILIQILRDVNVTKLNFEDVPQFLGFIKVIFPKTRTLFSFFLNTLLKPRM